VLRIVQPYLRELVLIGGWVPYLHQQYGTFRDWGAGLSLTTELDMLVVGCALPADGRPPLAELLLAAGLEPETLRQRGRIPPSPPGAAVWVGSPGTGEAIEFLVAHTGPLRRDNTPAPVTGQSGIAAIMLPDLALLERHTTTVQIPLQQSASSGAMAEDRDAVTVRIPMLGAYLLNKAVTFPKRTPRAGERINPKRGKDLLYLRDLTAAGTAVIDAIAEDIRSMLRDDGNQVQSVVDAAASHLEAIVRGAYAEGISRAAEMLIEREPGRPTLDARSDVLGYLTDLFDLLESFRSPFSPPEDEE